jgi:predicted ATPase
MQFATYESHSELYSHLRLQRNYRKERDGFFLRAESFYNVSSELDRREREYGRALRHYGEKSLHMQSHGEAFLSLINYRFGDESLFFLDEPEAALSPARQLSLLVQIDRLANFGSQFIIATHSPILMSYPNSTMYFLSEEGITETTWTETEHYQLTKTFLNAPEAFLKRLFVEPK